jgi:hypothetical protein
LVRDAIASRIAPLEIKIAQLEKLARGMRF